jgi:hypothetical protein
VILTETNREQERKEMKEHKDLAQDKWDSKIPLVNA